MENKYGLFDDTPNLYQRIKELEDELTKCQEIAMGLGIKELEDKLKIAVSAIKRIDNIAYACDLVEINNIACDALEKIGELK